MNGTIRKRQLGICYILTLLLVSFLLGISNASAAQETYVLKALTCHTKDVIFNMHVPKLIEMIEKGSGGKVKIEWVGGPEVIPTYDQPEAIKRGVIDMLLYQPFGYCKSLMPVGLAKGLSECTASEERRNGTFALWDQMFQEKLNAKYLGSMHSKIGFHIYSKKKIEKIDDLRAFRCRTMPLYVPFLKSLNASPITIPPTEVYTALQRGVVDGFMWPVFISDWGWQEGVKYVIYPSVFQIEAATLVNLRKWNALPKTLQDVISNAMEELEHLATEEFVREAEREWEKQKQAGMEKLVLPPSEAKKLHDAAYDITWQEVIKIAPDHAPKFRTLTSPCKK